MSRYFIFKFLGRIPVNDIYKKHVKRSTKLEHLPVPVSKTAVKMVVQGHQNRIGFPELIVEITACVVVSSVVCCVDKAVQTIFDLVLSHAVVFTYFL